MAFYRDKVQRNMLVDKIVQLLTTAPAGSTEPYWKQVQSGTFQNEGYILHSKGKSGTDNIYVRFHYDTFTNCIMMSMLEKYTPNNVAGLNGVIENESIKERVYYYNVESDNNSSYVDSNYAYAETYPVYYFLSFDRNKIMLVLKGDKQVGSYATQSLVWIGMPERMSAEKDSTAAAFAVSGWANDLANYTTSSPNASIGKCRLLRNRMQAMNPLYFMRTFSGFKTKGWGNHLLLSNIYLEDDSNNEGVRAIMDGVHPIVQNNAQADFNDGDEITIGSKRFTVFKVYQYYSTSDYSTNCFPSEWMAVEQLS